jgi:predicted regulator of Ras-like GTPase activity (Roadblock/LC7/MglB family)
MLRPVDAAQALADLTEISSQVVQVAVVDADGGLVASTIEPSARAARFVEALARLVDEAGAAGAVRGLAGLAQLEAATLEGSVFVVRDPGGITIAATTRADPTVGLVFYDLKHCLRSLAEPEPEPEPEPVRAAPRRRRKAADGAA